MPRNSLPMTTTVTLDGVEVSINQNGRVIKPPRAPAITQQLIESGHLRRDGGMLFVGIDTLAKAFGL